MVDWTLTVITDRGYAGERPLANIVRAALHGGATVVQLREKDLGGQEFVTIGQTIRDVTRAFQVPLIVNDRVDLALVLDAEGAHVGQDDLPAVAARAMLPGRILGVSARNLHEALLAQAAGADYLGVGPVFPAPTKPDAGAPIGLAALAEIVARVQIPVVAIGGINVDNVGDVMRTGVAGVAVISAIIGADDPARATRELRQEIERAKGRRVQP